MNINSACISRKLQRIQISTPLLIPSFSSTASENIRQIHEDLSEYISRVSLVSAYDIKKGFIDKNALSCSEVVFIDSGSYEKEYLTKNRLTKINWSYNDYLEVIDSLDSLNKFVIVNYDEIQPLSNQISNANELFSNYSDYACCFICKPTPNSMGKIDIGGLLEKINKINQFDALGLAEKELGDSLLARCANILKIREKMNSERVEVPIHIFGCLDPLCIISYFLCGADVFDGLSWLKFHFHKNVASYINNYPIFQGDWSVNDDNNYRQLCVRNLNEIVHLQIRMSHFTRTHNLHVLDLSPEILKQIIYLSGEAGIDYEVN